MRRISIAILFILVVGRVCFAEEPDSSGQKKCLFVGEVNSDSINIRSDSTVNSEVVCKINKKECVDVISESYDWYKIRLPQNAPSFIKKDFVDISDDKTATVSKDNVNVRLRPDTASAILGKIDRDEAVNILEDRGGWYKIEPINSSFGWIRKNFVNKIDEEKIKLAKKAKKDEREATTDKSISVEGIIKPKTFTRIATHKLITEDDEVYLLNGNKEELASLNGRRVKVVGKIIPAEYSNPIIEIEKIEALD